MRNRVDLSRLPDGLVRVEASLRVDQMRREDSVDERRLAQARLAYGVGRVSRVRRAAVTTHAPTTITLNWKPRLRSLCSICAVMLSKPT